MPGQKFAIKKKCIDNISANILDQNLGLLQQYSSYNFHLPTHLHPTPCLANTVKFHHHWHKKLRKWPQWKFTFANHIKDKFSHSSHSSCSCCSILGVCLNAYLNDLMLIPWCYLCQMLAFITIFISSKSTTKNFCFNKNQRLHQVRHKNLQFKMQLSYFIQNVLSKLWPFTNNTALTLHAQLTQSNSSIIHHILC